MKIITEFKKAKNIKYITKNDLILVAVYILLVAVGMALSNYWGSSAVCPI